jgi:hypothetical protein
MTTVDTPADAAALMLHKHKLQLSILVERIPNSKDPRHAWRFECVVHKAWWRSDEPLMKANGFARTAAEAQQKAEAWQLREITINGVDVLISAGDDLLRTEAYVPAMKMSIVQSYRPHEWTWRMPAADLVPVLTPAMHGLFIDSHDPAGPALRGDYGDALGSKPSAAESVAGVIAAARKQISLAAAAARSFADRMDKFC